MLPLWIIDITKKSSRRDEFTRLVGQIDNVFIPDDFRNQKGTKGQVENNSVETSNEDLDGNLGSVHSINDSNEPNTIANRTVDEVIASQEREEAARNAVIIGNYWYYSSYNMDDYFLENNESIISAAEDCPEECSETLKAAADAMYKFQEALVSTAKAFIAELRKSNAKPYQPFHVAVLGDVTEDFTQLVYASIASILRKEKGRFLPGHIHQGISIIGMLYIPCDVNTYEVTQRLKIQNLLKQIDVQHNISAIRGYDRMIMYQNVQTRTECIYPMLDAKRQAEYLIQCLVNMYYACDINHPIFQGTGSSDAFYISMGASSVYFDMSVEDESDASRVAQKLLMNFKENGDNETQNDSIQLFDAETKKKYSSKSFVANFKKEKIDLDEKNDDIPRPHPILDYMHRNLNKLYYGYYLKFFPAEILKSVLLKIEEQTDKQLDNISSYCVRTYNTAKMAIYPAINRVISMVNEHYGALSFIENELKDMQEYLSKEKKDVQDAINKEFWNEIMYSEDTIHVPKNQLDHFEEYHDAYLNDIKTKNGGAGCLNMRTEVITNLKKHLSKENTVLATLVGSILLGIMCVLGIVPLLDFISPSIVDLGDVKDNAFYWAMGVFLIPFIWQLISAALYVHKRNNYVRILKAYFKHDAYARIANRIDSESNSFYSKMINLLEEYLERCKQIREEVQIEDPNPGVKTLIPRGMFNQPLNAGKFGDQCLIPSSEIERCQIRVNYVPRMIDTLTNSHYYQLINSYKDELSMLFSSVDIIESHTRRFDKDRGDYVFVGRDTIEAERKLEWEECKEKFKTTLIGGISKSILPRQYATIGDKLLQYKKKIDRINLLEPVIGYAAVNGEVCADVNIEYADVKINRDLDELLVNYLPFYNTRIQVSKSDEIYQKYLFVTRWRCTDKLALNRILPKEDYDQDVRETNIYEDELKAKLTKDKHKNKGRNIIFTPKKEDVAEGKQEETYKRCLSSLILWAVCPDDNSNEWFNLFSVEHYSTAYEERNLVRAVMNQND
jgi:hypothetical protein